MIIESQLPQNTLEFTWNSSYYQQSINLYSIQWHFIPMSTILSPLERLNVQYKPCAYEFWQVYVFIHSKC